MKTNRVSSVVGVLACAILAGVIAPAAQAGEFNMNVSISGLSLGKHICGPERNLADLTDHVVLVEFWAVTCPPCLRSLPILSGWQDQFEKDGLIIVSIQCNDATPEQIKAVISERKATHSIYSKGYIKDGNDFSGIPHVFLFDHTGACVYRGSPFQVEEKMKEALAAAPAAALASLKLEKLSSLADSLKKSSPATVLSKASTYLTSKDEATAAEAAVIIEAVKAWGAKRIENAMAGKDTDALICWQAIQKIAKDFAGSDVAKEANKKIVELKADTAFMGEIKAWQALAKVKALEGSLKSVFVGINTDEETAKKKFKTRNKAVFVQMIAGIKMMQKNYPDSPATAEALAIAEAYELTPKK